MPRWLEISYPFIFSIIIGAVSFFLKLEINQISKFDMILSSSVTLSSIIIAFVATMISILISISNSSVMKRINKNNGESDLITYINMTVISGLLLVTYSLVLNVFIESSGYTSRILLSLFVTLLVFFLLSTYRIIRIVTVILTDVLSENKETQSAQKEVFTPTVKGNKSDINEQPISD
ncbi:hypothetical protein MKX40_17975 [Paenibacillus sp. FSL R5-0517]|uniref:hypothetical protein n=1 Tax=Paenibacillus sp. FSL R5-0517 TaxID=2921647 RepID=UPI0030D9FA75